MRGRLGTGWAWARGGHGGARSEQRHALRANHEEALTVAKQKERVTLFAEKDAVQALGTRPDAAKKIWQIAEIADLTPFLRRIPNWAAAAEDSTDGTTQPVKSTAKASINQFKRPTTGVAIEVPRCGCNDPPWNACLRCSAVAGMPRTAADGDA